MVLALDGAQIVLASLGVEPVPQGFPLDITMRVRALDDHVTMVYANYAGELPYLCSNFPAYTGEPLGRAFVVDRSGVVVADTGYRAAHAVAPIESRPPQGHLSSDFPLRTAGCSTTLSIQSRRRPAIERSGRRDPGEHRHGRFRARSANPRPDSEFAKILDEAGGRGSDVILMTEFGLDTDNDNGKATLALVAEKAKKNAESYIIIGGLHDPQIPYRTGVPRSWAYLW